MSIESADSSIGLINFDKNTSGKRSAGNLHATFDEAGAGNGRYNAPCQFSTLLVEEVSLKKRNFLRSMAFTLVELLVSIAIMIILMSILFPSLQKAKDTSKQIICMNNLKQCGLATFQYSNDFNGWMACIPLHIPSQVWHEFLFNGEYLTNRNVLLCPSYNPFKYTNRWRTYGVIYSSYIKFFRVTSPSSYIMYADTIALRDYIQLYYFRSPTIILGGEMGGIHMRHKNRATCWYIDGHCKLSNEEDLRNSSLTQAVKNYTIISF